MGGASGTLSGKEMDYNMPTGKNLENKPALIFHDKKKQIEISQEKYTMTYAKTKR